MQQKAADINVIDNARQMVNGGPPCTPINLSFMMPGQQRAPYPPMMP